ncbi:hypothetical protein LXL04_013156 [Taraxacum kok-saghyz]
MTGRTRPFCDFEDTTRQGEREEEKPTRRKWRPCRKLDSGGDSLSPIFLDEVYATTNNLTGMLVGRFIVGIGLGIGPPVASLYITEVSPPAVRGTCGSFIQISTCLQGRNAEAEVEFQKLLGAANVRAAMAELLKSDRGDENDNVGISELVYGRHSRGRLPIHGDASSKTWLYRDRFLLLSQRLSRIPHFSTSSFNSDLSEFGSYEISKIQSLVGRTGVSWVMGVISQLEDGHFYLEDLTAAVEVNLSNAISLIT